MRYTIYRYQAEGFGAGWYETEADTIPAGAVSVEVWDMKHADTTVVYVVEAAKVTVKK